MQNVLYQTILTEGLGTQYVQSLCDADGPSALLMGPQQYWVAIPSVSHPSGL